MTNNKISKTILFLTFASLPMLSWAGTDHDHDHKHHHDHEEEAKSHEAHVHGLAELTLAIEGSKVELALKSPAANIVGFEHQASTPEQKQTVAETKKTLESPQALFAFIGDECEAKQVEVDMSAVASSDDQVDTEKKAHDHHHDSHDDHKHHDDAHSDKPKNDDKKDADTHSEITANYQFDCKKSDALSAISVTLLDQFTGIETLNAMWITDKGQNAAELTAKSKDIQLQ